MDSVALVIFDLEQQVLVDELPVPPEPLIGRSPEETTVLIGEM